MKVNGRHFRTIWLHESDPTVVQIIDQRRLPHEFVIEDVRTAAEMAIAIRDMHVRGAGLIGAAAGFGMYLAALETAKSRNPSSSLENAAQALLATRPTAVNLACALEQQRKAMADADSAGERIRLALETARAIADDDAECCRKIGIHGLELIRRMAKEKKGKPVQILTHCNAGWLAFVDYGSATAPIYAARESAIPVHVWVDETRPRSQGSKLTAWELGQEEVPHTIVADNAAGHLMQSGLVDLVLVGSDRTTFTGDVANKVGTYLKALAARDNNVPFYVALPSSSFDWTLRDGRKIPIEERGGEEVKYAEAWQNGEVVRIALAPETSRAVNYAFDVTPRHFVTGLITERGICRPNESDILSLFPERSQP